jgi:hypothetical protein
MQRPDVLMMQYYSLVSAAPCPQHAKELLHCCRCAAICIWPWEHTPHGNIHPMGTYTPWEHTPHGNIHPMGTYMCNDAVHWQCHGNRLHGFVLSDRMKLPLSPQDACTGACSMHWYCMVLAWCLAGTTSFGSNAARHSLITIKWWHIYARAHTIGRCAALVQRQGAEANVVSK